MIARALIMSLVTMTLAVSAQAAKKSTAIQLEEGYGVAVTKVSQYRNLMPTIVNPGEEPRNTLITLIDIDTQACRELGPENFEVRVQEQGAFQLVLVKFKGSFADCRAVPRKQKLTIGTDLLGEKPVVVLNAVVVETLPDVH